MFRSLQDLIKRASPVGGWPVVVDAAGAVVGAGAAGGVVGAGAAGGVVGAGAGVAGLAQLVRKARKRTAKTKYLLKERSLRIFSSITD